MSKDISKHVGKFKQIMNIQYECKQWMILCNMKYWVGQKVTSVNIFKVIILFPRKSDVTFKICSFQMWLIDFGVQQKLTVL